MSAAVLRRPTAGTVSGPGPVTLWGLAVAGLAGVGLSAVLAATSDHVAQPVLHAGLFNLITVPYIVGGLVAWWRRPESRFGPLMVLAGFGPWLSALGWADAPGLYTVGQVFDLLPIILFLHVYLAFPSGRLNGSLTRAVVVTGYVAALGMQLVVMLLGGFGPENLLAVVAAPASAEAVHLVQLVLISGLALLGIGVLVARRRGGGRPLRRPVNLLVDSFGLGLLMIAVLLLSGAFNGPNFTALQRATFVVIGLAPIAFFVGLLNARLTRSGVGDLLLELPAEPGPADLRGPLARALRDPSLTLACWLPTVGVWADQDGRPIELPEPGERRAVTMIDRAGVPMVALLHDPALADEPELVKAVGAAAAIALENGRLRAELHTQLEEVRGSRARVIEAGQRERQRLERDLHDGAQQRLIALTLDLSLLEQRLAADSEVRPALARAKHEIAASLDELRDVARGLHPAVLTGHGLQVALESLAARASVPVTLTVVLDRRLAEGVEVAAYYVVCESLTNIDRHAAARSATVHVLRAGDRLVVEVVDDGVGGADTRNGTGLRGLADRVEALGGRLRVSTPPGGGTRVRAEIPCG